MRECKNKFIKEQNVKERKRELNDDHYDDMAMQFSSAHSILLLLVFVDIDNENEDFMR
jgi:hypothetical protein